MAAFGRRTRAAVLGLVYANKPEFLGDVNEELSARVGLTWTVASSCATVAAVEAREK